MVPGGNARVTSLEYPLRAEITLARDVTNSLGAEESSGEGKKEKKGTEKYRTRSRYREASDDASDKTPLRSGLTDLTALSLRFPPHPLPLAPTRKIRNRCKTLRARVQTYPTTAKVTAGQARVVTALCVGAALILS